MITITLLHPSQDIPLQTWSFNDQEESISIGRSTDNDIVVYSAVVSRYHLELKVKENQWLGLNLGANGTYINKQKVTQFSLEDGMIINLAETGPRIKVNLGIVDPETLQKTKNKNAPSVQNDINTYIREE